LSQLNHRHADFQKSVSCERFWWTAQDSCPQSCPGMRTPPNVGMCPACACESRKMVRCAVEIRHSVFHVGKVTRRHRSGCPRPGLFALPFVPANTERVDCTEWRLRCHSEAKNGTYPANLRPWSPPFLSPRLAWDGMLQRNHMAASTLPARTAGRYSCVPPRPKAAPVDAPPSKYASGITREC
jgi:hypothetical protein